MKIKNLKVNAFGNLKDREIEFSDHINIIKGNNESGKSTLLKFITNIFYGTSKNKKGREYSDFDKYKPWQGEEFSGKLIYNLDNGKQFEVFRDFNKKNPIIYNENKEDISKEFTIDKTYGNQFFIEQTNVDETMFLSTLVSMQQEVKIDKNIQNAMLQKVANLAGTGDDNISYKKALEKINKRQIEEIGTSRTQGRPINIVKDEKFKLQDEIGELEFFKERKQEIKDEKEQIKIQLQNIESKLDLIKKIKNIKEEQKIEQEKIKINEALKQNQEQRKDELENKKDELINLKRSNIQEKEQGKSILKDKSHRLIWLILMILGIILEVISAIFIKSIICITFFGIEIITALIMLLIENKKQKRIKIKEEKIKQKENQEQEDINKDIEKIYAEIKVLINNIEQQEKEIENSKQKIEIEQKNKIKNIESNLTSEEIENLLNSENIQNELDRVQEEKNNKELEYHSLELEEDTISPKIEKIAIIEEELEELTQREKDLEGSNKAIELAKEILEISYQKMKQNITPKLTEELSKNIQKISNGKYSKISLHEEEGIIVEKENGEYVEAEKLSIGTIDQLYLSLRLAMVRELTDESMPIILDEAFAYYDEQRLGNLLKYINEEYKDNQIIIFTCTNRENSILNKLNIEYNKIEL